MTTAATPWNYPTAFRAGFPLTTPELETELFNNLKHLYEVPAVSIVRSTALSITHSAAPEAFPTAVTGMVYDWSSHGNFSSAGTGQPYHVADGSIHLTSKGLWHIEVFATWEANTIYSRNIGVDVTPYSYVSDITAGRSSANDTCFQSLYGTLLTSSDDPVTLTVEVGQSSGVTLDVSDVRLTAIYGGNL